MGVIPSGTPDPWQWAKSETDNNNALYRMFLNQQQQKELMQQQQAYGSAQQAQGQAWQSGEAALNRQSAMDLANVRGSYYGRGIPADDPNAPAGENPYAQSDADTETQFNLPKGLLPTIAQLESSNGTNNVNPSSRARGRFQFVPDTARMYSQNWETDRMDPVVSAVMAAKLANDNRKAFVAALGREPTPAEYYLMHQQGAGGTISLMRNPNARAIDVVPFEHVMKNGGNARMTAGQFAGLWIGKFDRAYRGRQPSEQSQQDAVQQQPGVASAPTTQSGNPPPPQQRQQAAATTQGAQPAAVASAPAAAAAQAKPPGGRVEKVIGPDGKPMYKLVQ